jgi:predicted neutral ceramidase superfamily lipid hydrolase
MFLILLLLLLLIIILVVIVVVSVVQEQRTNSGSLRSYTMAVTTTHTVMTAHDLFSSLGVEQQLTGVGLIVVWLVVISLARSLAVLKKTMKI